MSKKFKTATIASAPAFVPDAAGQQASVRQLIANGNSRAALEHAKQLHKTHPGSVSEALLLEAYRARIQSLLDQDLASEAKSLLDLVRERFPSSSSLMSDLWSSVSARSGDLAELLGPLNDPALDAERRAALELIVQTEVTDLSALAACGALSPDHSLRQAAAALDRAFIAVTSGEVTDEQLVLPEVSRRSPLSSWKMLVHAIAALHGNRDSQCREYLEVIKPGSAPARLIPVIRSILDGAPDSALKPQERKLASQIAGGRAELRKALADLDRMFQVGKPNEVYKAAREAVRECRRASPTNLTFLKQVIEVRANFVGLDGPQLASALEGKAPHDATFLRMLACTLEVSSHSEDKAEACELWHEFRQHAIREGWFASKSTEEAMVYLHMARILEEFSSEELQNMRRASGASDRAVKDEAFYFLYPAMLFERACVIDPKPEAFSQWLDWAEDESPAEAEKVAKEWHRLCPTDIEPLLHLTESAEHRNAFPSALAYLEKAERIDPLNAEVRAGRLRLLASNAIRQLEQQKHQSARETLASLAGLPQVQQGNRLAFLAALRTLIALGAGEAGEATDASRETVQLLGDPAGGMLLFAISSAAKRTELVKIAEPNKLSKAQRAAIPDSLARVLMIARDFGMKGISLPISYFTEVEKQFPAASATLTPDQVHLIATSGLSTDRPKLTWQATSVGLKSSSPLDAAFLLLRSRALPHRFELRRLALAAAAVQLGRFHRDTKTVDEALEIMRDAYGDDCPSITLEQAREVVRKEAESTSFPKSASGSPYHGGLLPEPLCQCPECKASREGRGYDSYLDSGGPEELEDLLGFDEAEMRRVFDRNVPKGMPRGVVDALFEAMKISLMTGQSPEDMLSQIFAGGKPKIGKGGRKK